MQASSSTALPNSCLLCEDQIAAGMLLLVYDDPRGGVVPKQRQPKIRPIVCNSCRKRSSGVSADADLLTGRRVKWAFVDFRRIAGRKPEPEPEAHY